MALFLSTFEKQIDKKGRVSVPPTFRTVLSSYAFTGMVAYPSFTNKSIEACRLEPLEKLYQRIEALDPFSEERDAFSTAILASSHQLVIDSEGRAIIPEALLRFSGITESVMFVGKGATFEMWEPSAYAAQEIRMRELALVKRLSLKAGNLAGESHA